MRASIHRVDGVGEAEDVFRIAVVVLERHFHRQRSTVGQIALGLEVHRFVVQHLLALIEQLDEFGDTPGVLKFFGLLRLHALVGERDFQALVEERELPQAVGQRVVIELRHLHDGGVWFEGDAGSGFAAGPAGFHEWPFRNAARVLLLPGETGTGFAVGVPDLELQFFRERVHDADTHAVQAARHLVAFRIEFAAGVQLRHHHLRCRDAFFLVEINRDAAAVVHHRHRVVVMNCDVDLRAVSRHGFIHGVVDNFVHQVVQPHFAGRADVHGGPQTHRFQPLQHLDTR